MRSSLFASVAAAVVAAAGSAALADFFPQQPVNVTGTWLDTGWGTSFGQGPHFLGGSSTFSDAVYGPSYFVTVNTQIQSVNSLIMTVNLATFQPDGGSMIINVLGLKTDGSIVSVTSNFGTVTVNPDGNGFHWSSDTTVYPPPGIVIFDIVQSPTPGAAAALGLGGLVALRRRR